MENWLHVHSLYLMEWYIPFYCWYTILGLIHTILLLISWKWISHTLSTKSSFSNVTKANPEMGKTSNCHQWQVILYKRHSNCQTVTIGYMRKYISICKHLDGGLKSNIHVYKSTATFDKWQIFILWWGCLRRMGGGCRGFKLSVLLSQIVLHNSNFIHRKTRAGTRSIHLGKRLG